MPVTNTPEYRLVYSLSFQNELGTLIEPFVIQLNDQGHFTLSFQRVYSNTLKNFPLDINDTDRKLVELMDAYSHETITQKFHKHTNRPAVFFQEELNEDIFQKLIRPYIEKQLDKILNLLKDRHNLYLMTKSGNPTGGAISIVKKPSTVLFHFIKQENSTRYYPTIKNGDQLIKLTNTDARIICFEPCWLLVNNKIYYFDHHLNGKKLLPFLNKWYIEVSKRYEPDYYRKFISIVIKNYEVDARGFEIKYLREKPQPLVNFSKDLEGQPVFTLKFRYSNKEVNFNNEENNHVDLEENNGSYKFYKLHRNKQIEECYQRKLNELGLKTKSGAQFALKNNDFRTGHSKYQFNTSFTDYLDWLNRHLDELHNLGFKTEQKDLEIKYFIGQPELEYSIKEKNDWFDIYAVVKFGNKEIPFYKLRYYILNGIREIQLPSGEIAILPNEWFSEYRDLFRFAQRNKEHLALHKHHFNLVQSFVKGHSNSNGQQILLTLQKLQNRSPLKTIELPGEFHCKLRPYQKEGFSWLYFLKENNFGGCLADDMGLGKTIQTLALLVKVKESKQAKFRQQQLSIAGQLDIFHTPGNTERSTESQKNKENKEDQSEFDDFLALIVMPASLIHNWEDEIKRFTPNLKALNYTGINREELVEYFPGNDIILTTYGTLRNDIDLLRQFRFHFVILDESQVIKNPTAKISRNVKKLEGKHNLVLTGTPIENSLTDLWSQMAFLNPGLLGGYKFFKKEYVIPIEKKNDTGKRNKLKALIKPFVLRRTKEEVAKDLPSLTEKIQYCEMPEEQKQKYEEIKSFYRNQILENIETKGFQKSQFVILRGLNQLRLASNHPVLVDKESKIESGKFNEIIRKIESVTDENHKILVFSQFVMHLNLFRDHLNNKGIKYSYLTGQSKNRKEIIRQFQRDPERKIFLISLKAGGLGLNLVEADYVFITDPWWNPSAESQAINRAHRIGQDKSVISYKFITRETIEEKILKLQRKKSELAKDIVKANQSLTKMLTLDEVEMLLD